MVSLDVSLIRSVKKTTFHTAKKTAIDQKFASEQKLVIQQNENEANIAKAEAEAEAILIAAEAQAKANELLAESITDEILAQMYYEKWDGKLPYFYGADDALIEVPAG
jgi:regulator of protease activity HflC (stomatin/prohibitin superfamily)